MYIYTHTHIHICTQTLSLSIYICVTQFCLTLCNPIDCSPTRLLCPWNSPSKNTGVGCLALPNPGIKPGSPTLQADSLLPENGNGNLAGTGHAQRADTLIGSHKTEPFFPKIRVGKPMAHGPNSGLCVCVNQVLRAHSHDHPLTSCPWQLLHYRGRVEWLLAKPKRFITQPSTEKCAEP